MKRRWPAVAVALFVSACGSSAGTRADPHRPAQPAASPHVTAAFTGRPVPGSDAAGTAARVDPAHHVAGLRAAPWSSALDALIGDRPASVSVAVGGRLRYRHLGRVPRAPASNEKLLLTMALLDRFGPRARIPTTVEARGRTRGGVVRGDVWLVGHGDPELDEDDVARLAARLRGAGITRITGSVVGDTSTFRRDRWAPGWHRIALSFVSIPTALTFDANADASGFVFDPEREAAVALTADLERLGVSVGGEPAAGPVPDATRRVARVRSAPLVAILRRQNTASVNLDAEVLGKRLGADTWGGRGSIAAGARAIRAWAAAHGVRVVARDASGLSYANRITTDAFVGLLGVAEDAPWGDALRSTLPLPGTGTLSGRLAGIDVRAKTGTLIDGVSALSGWVRARRGEWAAFSILSAGMSKDDAVALEDVVVRFLAARA
jgi:D-alanyl-D-alanine carboxypeptidase/D-alanyl-D-alanine-endopeptidase (penicillin-binding protein 4)